MAPLKKFFGIGELRFLLHGDDQIVHQLPEDINVHIFTRDEVREILDRGMIVQALMAAPLWKYFANDRTSC